MSVTAGRLRHNDHRLQVVDIIVLRAACSTTKTQQQPLPAVSITIIEIAQYFHCLIEKEYY